jgi:NACHT domain
MPQNDLVRFSRDGDQFHYLWAARRCLQLLSPTSDLTTITIESASPSEMSAANPITAGEAVIDVAEYYGSETLDEARLIRYVQLKHSTVRQDEHWVLSELQKTISGFSSRFIELEQSLGTDALATTVRFHFISNRPIGTKLVEVVADAADDVPPRHPGELDKLKTFTSLDGLAFARFCRILRLEGDEEGYWEQRNLLFQDLSCYLPQADLDAPIQLKELITGKATSEGAKNPRITKIDVLRALRTDESQLFPAPCLIETPSVVVTRVQEREIITQIVESPVPVIVHAASGVGKSIFATRIQSSLPEGSVAILYDCFGNGQYRSATGYRHRHKDGLVQIANELASKAWCHPLIPYTPADSSAYLKAFVYRLGQSTQLLQAKNREALLCIVIDAADNAQMAAEENGETKSFARDLLREQLPNGVRLVVLCRTHRQHLLHPPPEVLPLELRPFNRTETKNHLRGYFSSATTGDVDEFHALSSQNPRVQALALSWKTSLQETLRRLGPNPTTVEQTIANLLEQGIMKLTDTVGPMEKTAVERFCAGLAVLRPLIPVSVLASIADLDESAVRSLAVDLGRPVRLTGDSIQFVDEPTETWFRERFKPKPVEFRNFIGILKPLASESVYVASVLPQLMWEAGHFDELFEMALKSESLPANKPWERRDIELQRLQFALKAALRVRRQLDATKVAIKAGGESAGDERQTKILQANSDLASSFFSVETVQQLAARRIFGSGWQGSHYAYEAGLMSGKTELRGDARSRLRMAEEWVRSSSRLPQSDRHQERISDHDVAEMATAHLNVHGPMQCARYLRSWRPCSVSFNAGRILASRLCDADQRQDLQDLALCARNNIWLILAISLELGRIGQRIPANVAQRGLRLLRNLRIAITNPNPGDSNDVLLEAVVSMVETGLRSFLCSRNHLSSVLDRFLPASPPPSVVSRFSASRSSLLLAYSLRAALNGKSLTEIDFADSNLRKEIEEKGKNSASGDAREFQERIGVLLPWYQLCADILCGRIQPNAIKNAVANAKAASEKAAQLSEFYQYNAANDVARIWFKTLLSAEEVAEVLMDQLNEWIESQKRPLYIPTLLHIARVSARVPALASLSLRYADRAFTLANSERTDAESEADNYVNLCRALLIINRPEAEAYFKKAIDVASKIGDENIERWNAILDLAGHAADTTHPAPEIAYTLSRCAELTYEYVARDKHFPWEDTVKAIAGLCPSSCLAIISRWRDRGFGRAGRLLPAAIATLQETDLITARAAVSLIPFRADWDYNVLLKGALNRLPTDQERETVAKFVFRYMSVNPQTTKEWTAFRDLVPQFPGLVAEIDELAANNESNESSSQWGPRSGEQGVATEITSFDDPDWESIFLDDLLSSGGLSEIYRRYKFNNPHRLRDEFLHEAWRRVAVGREVEFITAFTDSPEFNLYDLRGFLTQVPNACRRRLSVKAALAYTTKAFCRRYCMDIAKSRFYEVFPFKMASEMSGVAESELIQDVLSAVGESTALIDVRRLFSLVGLLATKLSTSESLEALSFGLNLFTNVLEEKDGDGSWTSALQPSDDQDVGVAGYVWAALSSPRATVRWEATHVVRALCCMNDERAITNLILFAKSGTAGAFADARLHFYDLHGRQWLLIALSMAVKDNPLILSRHANFFVEMALESEPHVLIRKFAADIALSLMDSGFIPTDSDLWKRLSQVNTSGPVVPAKAKRTLIEEKTPLDGEDEGISFVLDMGPYWFSPLGDVFGLSQSAVESRARQVIATDLRYSGTGRWVNDARLVRGIFRDHENWASHSSYPRSDDLFFYLCYHAMMITAGQLLARESVVARYDDEDDPFGTWLQRHKLTRADGYWLFDRRDPPPSDQRRREDIEEKYWEWSIRRGDFDDALGVKENWLNISGHWTVISNHREESIKVDSALVSSNTSSSLMRALQTTKDSFDYRIPNAEDGQDWELQHGEMRLLGWLTQHTESKGIDERDPWSGEIAYPSIDPAPFVRELMGLLPDYERREWHAMGQDGLQEVLRCRIWGEYRDKEDGGDRNSGRRLQASWSFLRQFLLRMNMDLIIEVEIERSFSPSRYRYQEGRYVGHIPRSTRIYIAKPDGRLITI